MNRPRLKLIMRIVFLLVFLFPVFAVVTVSLKSTDEFVSGAYILSLPASPDAGAFISLFGDMLFVNSYIATLGNAFVCSMIISIISAYAALYALWQKIPAMASVFFCGLLLVPSETLYLLLNGLFPGLRQLSAGITAVVFYVPLMTAVGFFLFREKYQACREKGSYEGERMGRFVLKFLNAYRFNTAAFFSCTFILVWGEYAGRTLFLSGPAHRYFSAFALSLDDLISSCAASIVMIIPFIPPLAVLGIYAGRRISLSK